MALHASAVSGVSLIAKSGTAVSAPADTNEDTLATITVPANAMGANGALRIKADFTVTSSGNTKTMRIRFSGASGTQYVNDARTAITGVFYDIVIYNAGATNSQKSTTGFGATSGASIIIAPTTSSVDTTAATTVVITGQKGSSGETLTLNWFSVELLSNGA
jgi:hypothetical protein